MFEKPEIPVPDGTDSKEVFAFYGLAMYNAQVFEKGILNLIVAAKISDSVPVTGADVDEFFQQLDRKTLGHLLHVVRTHVPFSEDIEDRIAHALVRRNDLAHQYFWRRAAEFMTDEGRLIMLTELSQDVRDLSETDALITPILFEYGTKFGMTEEFFARAYDEYRRDRGVAHVYA